MWAKPREPLFYISGGTGFCKPLFLLRLLERAGVSCVFPPVRGHTPTPRAQKHEGSRE